VLAAGSPLAWDHLPSTPLAINAAWCVPATVAADLPSWLRLLCLDKSLANAESRTLHYRVFQTRSGWSAANANARSKHWESWTCKLETTFLVALTLTTRPDLTKALPIPNLRNPTAR